MHTVIKQSTGWSVEILRDDSTLDDQLSGCSFIEETRRSPKVIAEVRYEEHEHNRRVAVEAIVLSNHDQTSKALSDVHYFRRDEFIGATSKQDAASYALGCKAEIDKYYF